MTEEDERQLWESGVFNTVTAVGLSYIMYFYNSKVFGFRAKDEHCELMAEQYTVKVSPKGDKYLQYNGRLTKNVTGSIFSKSTPRQVTQMEDRSNPRCIVKLFELYLSCIPRV